MFDLSSRLGILPELWAGDRYIYSHFKMKLMRQEWFCGEDRWHVSPWTDSLLASGYGEKSNFMVREKRKESKFEKIVSIFLDLSM